MNTKIILPFVLLLIVSHGGASVAAKVLTKCKVQSRTLSLKNSKPLRISGTVLSKGTNEYHLRASSTMNVETQLITTSLLKLDVYLIDPPTPIQKGVTKWSGEFTLDKEYVLAVNNCTGTKPAQFQIVVTPR